MCGGDFGKKARRAKQRKAAAAPQGQISLKKTFVLVKQ
jgi:hypothetical protein